MSRFVTLCAILGCTVLGGVVLGGAAPAIAAQAPAAPAAITPAPIDPATTGNASLLTLSKISCASPKVCLALGAGPYIPALVWDGKTWTQLAVPAPATGATNVILTGVSCVKGPSCVVVGQYTTASTPSTIAAFAMTWTGGKLTPTPALAQPAQVTAVSLNAVSCVTAKHCVAVGDVLATFNNADALLFETWNGSTWTASTKAVSTKYSAQLTDVSCVTATRCVTVGFLSPTVSNSTFSALSILWTGSSITGLKVPEPGGISDPYLTAVSCATATSCVATGFDVADLEGGKGLGFAEVLNKSTWTVGKVTWPKGTRLSYLLGVSCASARYCVAAGLADDSTSVAAAMVYNGTSWAAQNPPAPVKGNSDNLLAVSCAAASSCVAIGNIGPVSGSRSLLSAFLTGARWTLLTVK